MGQYHFADSIGLLRGLQLASAWNGRSLRRAKLLGYPFKRHLYIHTYLELRVSNHLRSHMHRFGLTTETECRVYLEYEETPALARLRLKHLGSSTVELLIIKNSYTQILLVFIRENMIYWAARIRDLSERYKRFCSVAPKLPTNQHQFNSTIF